MVHALEIVLKRDWSLRGDRGHVKFYPYEKGGGEVLAILKGGAKGFHSLKGGGVKSFTLTGGGGGGACAKGFRPAIFTFHSSPPHN